MKDSKSIDSILILISAIVGVVYAIVQTALIISYC